MPSENNNEKEKKISEMHLRLKKDLKQLLNAEFSQGESSMVAIDDLSKFIAEKISNAVDSTSSFDCYSVMAFLDKDRNQLSVVDNKQNEEFYFKLEKASGDEKFDSTDDENIFVFDDGKRRVTSLIAERWVKSGLGVATKAQTEIQPKLEIPPTSPIAEVIPADPTGIPGAAVVAAEAPPQQITPIPADSGLESKTDVELDKEEKISTLVSSLDNYFYKQRNGDSALAKLRNFERKELSKFLARHLFDSIQSSSPAERSAFNYVDIQATFDQSSNLLKINGSSPDSFFYAKVEKKAEGEGGFDTVQGGVTLVFGDNNQRKVTWMGSNPEASVVEKVGSAAIEPDQVLAVPVEVPVAEVETSQQAEAVVQAGALGVVEAVQSGVIEKKLEPTIPAEVKSLWQMAIESQKSSSESVPKPAEVSPTAVEKAIDTDFLKQIDSAEKRKKLDADIETLDASIAAITARNLAAQNSVQRIEVAGPQVQVKEDLNSGVVLISRVKEALDNALLNFEDFFRPGYKRQILRDRKIAAMDAQREARLKANAGLVSASSEVTEATQPIVQEVGQESNEIVEESDFSKAVEIADKLAQMPLLSDYLNAQGFTPKQKFDFLAELGRNGVELKKGSVSETNPHPGENSGSSSVHFSYALLETQSGEQYKISSIDRDRKGQENFDDHALFEEVFRGGVAEKYFTEACAELVAYAKVVKTNPLARSLITIKTIELANSLPSKIMKDPNVAALFPVIDALDEFGQDRPDSLKKFIVTNVITRLQKTLLAPIAEKDGPQYLTPKVYDIQLPNGYMPDEMGEFPGLAFPKNHADQDGFLTFDTPVAGSEQSRGERRGVMALADGEWFFTYPNLSAN